MMFTIVFFTTFMAIQGEKRGCETRLAALVRGCYFDNTALYRTGFTVSQYSAGLCTHIMYSSAGINSEFKIVPTRPDDATENGQYRQINDLKQTDPGLKKTLLTVGVSSVEDIYFKPMTKSASLRQTFIASAIHHVRQWDFDGLDIDWEYPEENEKDDFAAFLKDARAAMQQEAAETGKPELLLTSAVPAAVDRIDSGFDVTSFAKYVDYIFVISMDPIRYYDSHESWDETGIFSPVFGLVNAGRYWHRQGMPKEKIVLGLPTYARGWTLPSGGQMQINVGAPAIGPSTPLTSTNIPGFAAYYELKDLVASGAGVHWSRKYKQSYIVHGDQWFAYDDTNRFQTKLQRIKAGHYGGAYVWALDMDEHRVGVDHRYQLLNTIKRELSTYMLNS